jgi:hypothetical protein
MAKFPTFQHPSLGVPVRLTKANALGLAQEARRYGYLNRGHSAMAGSQVAEVFCPLCRERVQGYYGQYSQSRTAALGLDRAVLENLVHDCSAVTRP